MLFKGNKLRVVFFGSSSFAVPSLEVLEKSEDVVLAVTKPDSLSGRGYAPTSTAVKEKAEVLKIKVSQPQKLNSGDFFEEIVTAKPDLIVVVDYGKILPRRIFEIPPLGCIALHPSLLPKYRGPAPIETALANGDTLTGVTVFFMEEEVDSGDIIIQKEEKIYPEDTGGTLRERLSVTSAEVLCSALKEFKENKVKRIPQDDNAATFTSKIDNAVAKIKWENNVDALYNLVRALNPKPAAYTCYKGKSLKILEVEILRDLKGAAGRIEEIRKNAGFVVGASGGALLIKKVQPEGKNIISAWDFVLGYKPREGDKFE